MGQFYRIKEGSHQLLDLTIAKKGDLVESDLPLDAMFANKFERARDVEQMRDHTTGPDSPLMAEFLAWKSRKESPKPVTSEEVETSEGAADAGNPVNAPSIGEDVTAEYPKAVEQGFLVFKQGDGTFNVADADAKGKALNEEPLAGKAKVNAFIKSLIKA